MAHRISGRPGPVKKGMADDGRAIQTLSTFLSSVLAKKYTNPSSDIITVLAGLDHIDAVFTDFVGSLDYIIRNGQTSECGWRRHIHERPQLGTCGLTERCSGNTAEGCRGRPGHYVRGIPDQPLDVLDTEGHVPICHEGETAMLVDDVRSEGLNCASSVDSRRRDDARDI